jgi:hypothetical protein
VANFLGRLQTFLFGAAIGRAASDSITPVLEPVRQHAWEQNQVKVLDPATAAEATAKGVIGESEAEQDAARSGVGVDRFGVLLRLAQDYPGSGELMRLLNRQKIGQADVIEALTRHGIPAKYHGPIVALFDEILTPGELAAAIHRGLVPSGGLLLGEQPAPPFKVEAYPVQEIDPLVEAQGSGFDRERLQVLVGLQGLPMGPHEAAQALFRGIITHGDYIRAFNTSNMRNEWAQAILDQTRQIPTARDFFENALRGYHDLAWAQEQAQRHGMSEEDSLVIYQNQGRPMNIRQITQALARGAKFNPEPGEIKDPYLASIVEGPVKPGYYELAESLKYTLPSAFVMRQLAQSGVWDEAKTAERLKWLGWFPDDADEVAKAWAKSATGATVSAYVGKAQTQLWTAIHKSYVTGAIDGDRAGVALETLIADAETRDAVLTLWAHEKDIAVKELTPSQVKAAYKKSSLTIDEAVARLEERGMIDADARIYLTT